MHLGDHGRVCDLHYAAHFRGGVDSAPRFPEHCRVRFIGDDEQAVTIGKVKFHRPALEHFLQGWNLGRFPETVPTKPSKPGSVGFVGSLPADSRKIGSLGFQFSQRLVFIATPLD